jgi:GNAT superfamily N-acetyltransferase
MKITLKTFDRTESQQYIWELARLRMEIFQQYPYLYDGSMEEEAEYLASFVQANQSLLVLAFDRDTIVGASTAMPLKEQTTAVQQPWLEDEQDLTSIFYLGESVLQINYRNKGIGVQFFKFREQWAREHGYHLTTFCGVIRPDDHPLKPDGYTPLDEFWYNRGYQKKEGYICHMSWKDINEAEESPKPMQFWYKHINS